MKTKEELIIMLKSIENDDRLHDKPALIQINAPLALIQVNLKSVADTLRLVLEEDAPPKDERVKC